MKTRTILFLLLIQSSLLSAQERTYNLAPFTIPIGGVEIFNGKVHLAVFNEVHSGNLDSVTSSILVLDQDGNLEQELKIDSLLTDQYLVPTALATSGTDTLMIALDSESDSSYLQLWNARYEDIGSYPLVNDSGRFLPTTINHFSDTCLMAGIYFHDSLGAMEAVRVYKAANLVKELNFANTGSYYFISTKRFKDKYLLGYNSANNEYLAVLNRNFEVDTVLARANSPDASTRDIHDFIVAPGKEHFYTIMAYQRTHFGIARYDQHFNRVSLDTLPALNPGNFSSNENFRPIRKFCDYRNPDSIFMIGSRRRVNNGQQLNPAIENKLKIACADTSGKWHWSRDVGEDGCYYYPGRVLATEDGGALVFSAKYNPQTKAQAHYLLSIIKIQGDGSVLNEREYSLSPASHLNIYPNPANDYVRVSLQKHGKNTRYRIMNLSGQVVLQGPLDQKNFTIHLTPLVPGSYHLEITDENGLVGVQRFVRN